MDENYSSGPPRDIYEKVKRLTKIEARDLIATFMKKVENLMKIEVRDLLVTFMKKLKNW